MTRTRQAIPDGCVSVELLNIEREVADDLRARNAVLRTRLSEIKQVALQAVPAEAPATLARIIRICIDAAGGPINPNEPRG